jgi:hypothetical protein
MDMEGAPAGGLARTGVKLRETVTAISAIERGIDHFMFFISFSFEVRIKRV